MREIRYRLLLPFVLAGLSLGLGVTLTSAIEQSREASGHLSAVIAAVSDASRLVAPLRLSNAEMIGSHASYYQELWLSQKARIETMVKSAEQAGLPAVPLRTQIERSTALFAHAAAAAAGPAGKLDVSSREVAKEAAGVWALWHRAEADLNTRLAIELAGPQEKWSSAAGLAFLGCLASGLLFWSWWYAAEWRKETVAVESRLRETEQRARLLAESSRELLLQCDAESGRILRANRKLAVNSVAELLGSSTLWRETSNRVAAGEGPAVTETRIQVGGQTLLAEWRIWPVRDASGGLTRIDMAFLDITGWDLTRQAAGRRIAELEQARDKLERQTRELLNQSFELAESRQAALDAGAARLDSVVRWGRTLAKPLEEAAALASQLEREAPPPQREATACLARTIDSVAGSLHSLAEFVGIEAVTSRAGFVEFSPRTLVEELAEESAERAEAKGLEMPCFFSTDLPELVTGDLARIRRALGQVIEHAIRHTTSGEVSLRAGLETGDSSGKLALRFEVEDSGAGFAPAALQALFEPFAPGLNVTEVASGLAIAKRLADSIEGRIGGESDQGQGTRIWMVLPVEPVLGAGAATSPSLWPDLAGRRILVVDDVASLRGALIELASSIGTVAVPCSDGATALAQIQSAAAAGEPYAFVLADCEMPEMSGIQLAEAIFDQPAIASSTAVTLTIPYSQRRWSHESPMQGIRGLLTKPVRRQALVDLLRGAKFQAKTRLAAAEDFGDEQQGEEGGSGGLLPEGSPAPAPTVLIVEDNLVNQRVAVRLVEKMGLRAAVAMNGLEAIRAVQRQSFELILMDCQMPEVDGFAATAEIRRLEGGGTHVPIIAMTANAMRGDRERCLAAGMDDYLAKPVAFEDLRVLVKRWLARAEVAK